MARYSKIERVILNDAKFNQLSDDAQRVFFRLWVHPHLTSLGAMRAAMGGLAGEMHWPASRFSQALAEITAQGMVQFDETAHLLWFPHFLKYNPPGSPNGVKSWGKAFDQLPACELKETLKQQVPVYVSTLPRTFQAALPAVFLDTSNTIKERN